MKTAAYEYTEHDTGKMVKFDYDLQVWTIGGVVQECGHPQSMRPGCCNADRFKGLKVEEARRQEGV